MRVGPMAGRWQNWKAKPMTRGEFIVAFATGLVVLVLLETRHPLSGGDGP